MTDTLTILLLVIVVLFQIATLMALHHKEPK